MGAIGHGAEGSTAKVRWVGAGPDHEYGGWKVRASRTSRRAVPHNGEPPRGSCAPALEGWFDNRGQRAGALFPAQQSQGSANTVRVGTAPHQKAETRLLSERRQWSSRQKVEVM